MANRLMNQFRYSFEQKPKEIFLRVVFGAAGAPTLQVPWSKGVTSITQNATGDYTIQLADKYTGMLKLSMNYNSGSAAPAAPAAYIKTDSLASSGSIRIVTNLAGTATNPASGEIAMIQLILRDSQF